MYSLPAVRHNPKGPRFYSFDMHSLSKPQFVIPDGKFEMINESCINYMTEYGKYRFILFITPNVRDILSEIMYVCEFQYIYSFTVNPRQLNWGTQSIRKLFVIRHGV